MFNLLMFDVDWLSGSVSVPLGRIFEYTSQPLIDQFRVNGIPQFERLVELPCIFCVEGTADEIAYVGTINRTRVLGADVSLDVSIDRNIPRFKNSFMYANRGILQMPRDFEFSRNHWAVKDLDLYLFLLRNTPPRRQRPTVFPLPENESVEPTLASVMMPFEAAFNDVYSHIRRAAENVGMNCRRADDFWEHPEIMYDIVALIDRSRIVVCDCTGRNPNVFYEAGIAHTLGREVILIAQNDADIPFDLRHLRYVRYLNNEQGRADLVTALQARMQTLLGR